MGDDSSDMMSIVDQFESPVHEGLGLESISEKPLSSVSIRYDELPNTDHQPIPLFADPSTKSR